MFLPLLSATPPEIQASIRKLLPSPRDCPCQMRVFKSETSLVFLIRINLRVLAELSSTLSAPLLLEARSLALQSQSNLVQCFTIAPSLPWSSTKTPFLSIIQPSPSAASRFYKTLTCYRTSHWLRRQVLTLPFLAYMDRQ
jgi:hypothetical protein